MPGDATGIRRGQAARCREEVSVLPDCRVGFVLAPHLPLMVRRIGSSLPNVRYVRGPGEFFMPGCGATFDEKGCSADRCFWRSAAFRLEPRTAADQPKKRLVRATQSICLFSGELQARTNRETPDEGFASLYPLLRWGAGARTHFGFCSLADGSSLNLAIIS